MTDRQLRWFDSTHLPPHLQDIVRPFQELATAMTRLPPSPERSTCLRKLLEAKDCAVRARLLMAETDAQGTT